MAGNTIQLLLTVQAIEYFCLEAKLDDVPAISAAALGMMRYDIHSSSNWSHPWSVPVVLVVLCGAAVREVGFLM